MILIAHNSSKLSKRDIRSYLTNRKGRNMNCNTRCLEMLSKVMSLMRWWINTIKVISGKIRLMTSGIFLISCLSSITRKCKNLRKIFKDTRGKGMNSTMLAKIKKEKKYGNLLLEEWLLLESSLQLISIQMHDINMCKINSLGIF